MNYPPENSFVSGYLLYMLATASEHASEQFHEQVRAHGLRVPEWRVLACLVDNDGLMITHLAQLSLIEQSRMTRIINQMTNNGYLERCEDIEDKRRVRVRLTKKGRKIAKELVKSARAHEEQLLSALEDTDAAQIKRALDTLLTVLQQNRNL